MPGIDHFPMGEQDDPWIYSPLAIGLDIGSYAYGSISTGRNLKKYKASRRDQRLARGAMYNATLDLDDRLAARAAYGKAGTAGRKFANRARYGTKISKASVRLGMVGLFAFGTDVMSSIIGARGASAVDRTRRGLEYLDVAGYVEEDYFDSRAAFTQRQRAIQVIHNSQLTNRAAFGNEAAFMHH
jgi:hypothetical protein